MPAPETLGLRLSWRPEPLLEGGIASDLAKRFANDVDDCRQSAPFFHIQATRAPGLERKGIPFFSFGQGYPLALC